MELVNDKGAVWSNVINDEYYKTVTLSNQLARALSNWTLEEMKIFFYLLSYIDQFDGLHVILDKRKTMAVLGYASNNGVRFKNNFLSMMKKSDVQLFNFESDNYFKVAMLVIEVEFNGNDINVTFNPNYKELLTSMKRHYTKLRVGNFVKFKHKSSFNLYLYLKSWIDYNSLVNVQNINSSELAFVFNLTENQYCRVDKYNRKKLHFGDFEKNCLNVAIKEINDTSDCDIFIQECQKVKDKKSVLGYSLAYCLVDINGNRKVALGVR